MAASTFTTSVHTLSSLTETAISEVSKHRGRVAEGVSFLSEAITIDGGDCSSLSIQCSFCGRPEDSSLHYFLQCPALTRPRTTLLQVYIFIYLTKFIVELNNLNK